MMVNPVVISFENQPTNCVMWFISKMPPLINVTGYANLVGQTVVRVVYSSYYDMEGSSLN